MSQQTIGQNSRVTLHYSLAVEDGSVLDSSFDGEPVAFKMGDGTLIAGLEHAIIGLQTGDSQTIGIPAEFGYGFPDPAAIQHMPLSDFPPELTPKVREIISFTVANGEEIPGTVLEITDTEVKVDFNHPFAGHEITFTSKIIAVENS